MSRVGARKARGEHEVASENDRQAALVRALYSNCG